MTDKNNLFDHPLSPSKNTTCSEKRERSIVFPRYNHSLKKYTKIHDVKAINFIQCPLFFTTFLHFTENQKRG